MDSLIKFPGAAMVNMVRGFTLLLGFWLPSFRASFHRTAD